MSGSPLWLNAALFALAAVVIWHAGTRLEHYASIIARHTGLGQAFGGLLLLAVSTSLPEVATTVTAVALLDNPTLAVHNLVGGVALQTGILAIADRAKREPGALTFFSPKFVLLVEGLALVLLLQLTVAGIAAGGAPVIASTSMWLVLVTGAYVGMVYIVYRHRHRPGWKPERTDDAEHAPAVHESGATAPDRALRTIVWLFGAMSALVLVGGWLAAQTADVLAAQTGLGDAFLGATLLAAATSLPEVSTTVAAARRKRYTAAVSNVFGSNGFCLALLLVADILYRDGTILAGADLSMVFIATIGAVMTCIYLWGLLERENRTVAGIGWDSAAASAIYVGSVAVLYFMQ
jgi:cation:H+ antiporter